LYKKLLCRQTGFELKITSDFNQHVGLGSSAAVTAATLGVLANLESDFDRGKIFKQGFNVIRNVQGTGSGADLAASVFGGILKYKMEPQSIKQIPGEYPITVVYSGSKTPTTEVIQLVNDKKKQNPELFESIFETMSKSSVKAAETIRQNDWAMFGEILNVNQGLMDAIGVNNPALAEINFRLRQDENILGSKISGSGLGDCVVGLGQYKRGEIPFQIIPMEISQCGVKVE
jgi:mevalonate kinase